ncbi:MAG: hypothetical protein MSG64_07065 [Pyrinomonadaceae bacterium MAG19_C2-C3]|nr:hypothetical protein [Pyrinomonadaceae bacterium MAG19_C2-C3]
MSPDEVCAEYAERDFKLTCKMMDGFVLLEGTEEALEFLGKLILAQAHDERSCKKTLQPNGAGSIFFTEESNVGIYIHRLPCRDGKVLDSEFEIET